MFITYNPIHWIAFHYSNLIYKLNRKYATNYLNKNGVSLCIKCNNYDAT